MNVLSLFPTLVFEHKCNLNLDKIKFDIFEFTKNVPNVKKSNISGYQGHGYKNTELETIIDDIIPENGIKHIQIKIESWVNINEPGGYNDIHNHDSYAGTFLSGVFFVSAPKHCGNLRLYDPRPFIANSPDMKYYNLGNTFYEITPIENLLILFPGWLLHSVEPNNSVEKRISIAFNVVIQ